MPSSRASYILSYAIFGLEGFVVFKAGSSQESDNSDLRGYSILLTLLYYLRLRKSNSTRHGAEKSATTQARRQGIESASDDDDDWVKVEGFSTPVAKKKKISAERKPGCDEEGWRLEASLDQPYVHNDHEFAHCKFYHDKELESDILYVQSRAKVPL